MGLGSSSIGGSKTSVGVGAKEFKHRRIQGSIEVGLRSSSIGRSRTYVRGWAKELEHRRIQDISSVVGLRSRAGA